MHFLSYGDGHAGGVCSFTDYLQANEDGAWVGLERYPHPTDTQYSWASRLAEVYSARIKSFCRHHASFESICQEVLESFNMYEFDECYSFIGIPNWKKRIYHLYGDWGSAKNHRWSKHYHKFGIDCQMDGNDFDRDFGKQLVIEMFRTNGIRPGDTSFKSWYDQRFATLIQGLDLFNNPAGIEVLSGYHPEDENYQLLITKWLDQMEREYLEECDRINALTTANDRYIHFMPDLLELLEKIKDSRHKFFFYFTEDSFPFPKNNTEFNYTAKKWGEEENPNVIKTRIQLDHPNIYWFWGVCMMRFFDTDLDNNVTPRLHGYFKHEDHYEFSKYMRTNLARTKLI